MTDANRFPRLLLWAALGIVLLHFAAPVFVTPTLWGVRSWSALPFGARALLVVVCASLMTAGAAAKFDSFWNLPSRNRWIFSFGVAAALSLFILFRSQEVYGNPDIAVDDARRGRLTLKHPMAGIWSAAVVRVFNIIDRKTDPLDAVAVASALSGILYILGAFVFARTVFPASESRRRVLAFILVTMGAMQQFFGVIENYGFGFAMQMWALVGIVKLARPASEGGWNSPVKPAFLSAMSTTGFVATVFLWPATLFAMFLERKRGVLSSWGKVVSAAFCALIPMVVSAALLQWFAATQRGYGWRALIASFGGMDGSAWVPLTIPEGHRAFFTLFSLEHLYARLNLAFLATPLWPSLLVAAWIVRQSPVDDVHRKLTYTLGLAAAGALSFFVLVHPDLGPTVDWMQTAAGTLAPTAFLAVFVLSRSPDSWVPRLGTICIPIALCHLLPWSIGASSLGGAIR